MRVRNIRGGRFGDTSCPSGQVYDSFLGCVDSSVENVGPGSGAGSTYQQTSTNTGTTTNSAAPGCPSNAVSFDLNGNCIDANGNILNASGQPTGQTGVGLTPGQTAASTAGSGSAPWYTQVLTSLQSIGQSGAKIFGAKPAVPGASSGMGSFLLPLLFVGGAIGIAVYATRKK